MNSEVKYTVHDYLGTHINLYYIPYYDKRYRVDEEGNVYSLMRTDKIVKLKPAKPYGYPKISLLDDTGKRVSREIHILVCNTFSGSKPDQTYCVRHLDNNPENNHRSNLVWSSYKGNLLDKYLYDTHDCGCNNSRASANKEQLFVTRWLLDNTLLSHRAIGDIVGFSRVFITKIKNNHRYKHVHVDVTQSTSPEKLDQATKDNIANRESNAF